MLSIGTIGTKKIGITFDQTGVRFAALRKKKEWEIERTGFLPLPEGLIVEDQIMNPESIQVALKQWVKAQKLTGASVTFSVPTSLIIVRKMKIPTTNAKELRHLVELEVETTLHLPFEDPVYDFVRIGMDEESTQVLIFAAPSKWIVTCADLLHNAGLKVKGADLAASALAKLVFADQVEPATETMIVHIGESVLDIYMFHEGNPIFMRAINLNETAAHERGKLNELQVAEVTAELSRMLNFYQFGLHEGASRISRTILAGPAHSRAALLSAIRESQPEMSVSEADYSALEASGSQLDGGIEPYLVASGLTLPDERKFHINLMPRIDREARIFPAVLGGTLVLWALLFGLTSYMYISNKGEIADNKAMMTQLNDELALLQNELASGSSDANINPQATIAAIKSQQRDVVGIVSEMQRGLPKGAILGTVNYSASGEISVSAGFLTMRDASRYLFDLRRMSFVADATMGSIIKEEQTATLRTGEDAELRKPYSASFAVKMRSLNAGEEGNADGTAE
ncbi:type IV pilus biogenesis protein PilM [Paenibacillus xanthanilyticus]|uniref:Type IV pilus biogenesis protein PilM n=1 Tax=Paenibacillus xanthanilyticus TaxID=1783531 RepID=A0ABV8KBF7_9BACL